MKYYITHIIKDDLPKKGFRKILFCTTNTELYKKNMYLYGKGVKKLNQEFIDKQVDKGVLIEIPNRKELKDGYGLWVDTKGKIYYANYNNPFEGKIEELFAPEAMTKTRQIFNKKFGHLTNKTKIKRFVKLEF